MCDYFWKKMENGQGDLADIVRASGRAGGTVPSVMSNDWQFIPSEPVSCFPLLSDHHGRREDQEEEEEDVFSSDPFGSFSRDPLLQDITVSSFFDHGQDLKRGGLHQEITRGTPSATTTTTTTTTTTNNNVSARPCDVFSRVLQISPGVSKPSQMIRSSGGCQPELGDIQISSPRTAGIKRRKSQAKKVVCIPAPAAANSRTSGEVVPSDLWAWRKYGQKPIKGSPYPRGYYRCSSSKGCSARKQVERSRTDPNMLVITYTSEHNHPWPTQRNALAGSTRSQTSKNVNSSSTQKNNQKQVANLKEEPKDTTSSSSTPLVKQEGGELAEKAMDVSDHDQELDQMFVGSYKPMIPECNHPDDFFADLAELDPDPMSLIFSKGIDDEQDQRERNSNNKSNDPFSIFDWGVMNSFGESKRGL